MPEAKVGLAFETLVLGTCVPVLRRVSMSQIGLDLTGVPQAREGDEEVLVREQGGESVTVDGLARSVDTISYEILYGVSARVPRRYMHAGKQQEEAFNLLGCSPARKRGRAGKELSL